MHLFRIFCESAFSRRLLRTKNHASLQLISDRIQIIRFYLSLVRSDCCKGIINRWQFSFSKGEKWYDKLFNVKYLPLFHHFKAIYQFPKHIIFLVKIVAKYWPSQFKKHDKIVISLSKRHLWITWRHLLFKVQYRV